MSNAPAIDALESRRLMSVSVAEAESNDNRAHANVLDRVIEQETRVSGSVGTAGDRDWFRIELQQGDVFGAIVTGAGGLNASARLVDAAGDLMIGCDDGFQVGIRHFGDESPLPRVTSGSDLDPELYYQISRAGTYFVEVSASSAATGPAAVGAYAMDLVVARPGMESKPLGAKQILYLDLDGASVDFRNYYDPPLIALGRQRFSGLSKSLGDWGLTKADEDALIDQIVARVTDKLATFVQANGSNATSGIEIRNSRDHADTFGKDPLVSRVVVGTADDPSVTGLLLGVAEHLDVGNYQTDDEAVVTMDWFANAVANVGVQPPATVVDATAEAVALYVGHEFGHILGCIHTQHGPDEFFTGTPNLMDGDLSYTLGPDFIFGSADDIRIQFGPDAYWSEDPYQGLNDTLNTVAFALSTGRGAAAAGSDFIFATMAGGSGVMAPTSGSPSATDLFAGEDDNLAFS